jgi:hypothetical protein
MLRRRSLKFCFFDSTDMLSKNADTIVVSPYRLQSLSYSSPMYSRASARLTSSWLTAIVPVQFHVSVDFLFQPANLWLQSV